MSFRDFIGNWRYRRRVEREFARFQNLQPPKNPSRRYIDKLVRRLLDERKAHFARKELEMIGAAAAPSLAAALMDERFREGEGDPESWNDEPPLDVCLELLVPHDPETVLAVAMPLVDSPSEEIRKTAALHVASLGDVRTLPALARLLRDDDGYVRSYVAMGMGRAVSSGRASADYRAGCYDLLLPQCDQKWKGTLNDAAGVVVKLDRARAAVDFATQRWLSPANPYAHQIVQSCNEASIALPEPLLRALLDHSAPLAVGEDCYPHDYVVAAVLKSLAKSIGERARALLVDALAHEQDRVREAAAQGLARLAGVDDPAQFVCGLVENNGVHSLTSPQRVVYFANIFDWEVCNGGIMQFFGNSSGDHVREVLDALREIGHSEAERALAIAVEAVGPLAYEEERELRLAAFEEKFDELRSVFEPLENAFYKTSVPFRQKVLLYAAEHSQHFEAR